MGYVIEAADRFVKIGRDEASIIADMLIEEMARIAETKPAPVTKLETSKTFEIGNEYFGTFICDSDSTAFVKIVGRTPKQIKFVSVYNGKAEEEVKRVKIFTDSDGFEYFFPFGQYSMALTIRANHKA